MDSKSNGFIERWARAHRIRAHARTFRKTFAREGEEAVKEAVVRLFDRAEVEEIGEVVVALATTPELQELVVKEAKRLLRVRGTIWEIVSNAKDG